jgi:type I restriction enzyme, S subunit
MRDLPTGWKRATLGEIGVEAKSGFSSGEHNNEGNGVVHLRPMNITREGRIDLSDVRYVQDGTDRRARAGDVLFNNTNSPALVGKTALVTSETPLGYSNHMTRLRPSGELRPDFLARQLHWLWMKGYFKTVLKNHVNQASVASERLLETLIDIPPLAEQQRIAETLESHLTYLVTGLGALERASALSVELISTSLLRATVDSVEAAKWDSLQIGQMAKVSTGATPLRSRTDYYENGTVPWVTSGLLNKPYVDAADKMITELALRETSVKLFPAGTLLVAMYGEGRTRGRCSELRISATTNQACAAIQLDPKYEDRRPWIKLVLEASYHRTRNLAVGGVQPNLSLGLIRRIRIPLPPLEVQVEIIDDMRGLRDSEARLDRTLEFLRVQGYKLREAIFRHAFEGR